MHEKSAAEIKSLHNELSSFRMAMERSIISKDAEIKLLKRQLFGKKSLKGRRTKQSKGQGDDQDKDDPESDSENRDNFDGTPESIMNTNTDTGSDTPAPVENESDNEDDSQTLESTGKW